MPAQPASERPAVELPAVERPAVAVVIPAKNEGARIAATVRAAATIPGVDLVLVVDDGSTDGTADVAANAGAIVTRHRRNQGKAAAMETGAETVAAIEQREQIKQREQREQIEQIQQPDEIDHPDQPDQPDQPERRAARRALLFLDADLEETAAAAAALVPPVLDGRADMTIAILPPQRQAGGGHGFVVRLSRDGIRKATGFCPTQPLSGQRCLTRAAFEAARPLAPGFGVETGLTVDLIRRGFVVTEVEVDLHHRVTGTDWRAQVHRARQYRDVARALAVRRVLPAPPAPSRGRN